MKKGTVVKFRNPLCEIEVNQRMVVIDWYENSDRCLVQDVSNLPLPGTHVCMKDSLEKA